MKKPIMMIGAAATLTGAVMPVTANAALKFEPDSYVQDGLVVHLDGIRNAGADRPHDPTASTWADLTGNVGGVMFVKRDASDTSAWTDDGYLFTGMSYGITAKLLPEMANLTIEAFGDFPANQQRTSPNQWQEYANYVSANVSGKDFAIFTYNGQATLFWKTDNFGVSNQSRPQFGSWNCQNFSCVLGADTAKMYENGVQKTSQPRTSQPVVPATKYVLANSGNQADYLTGNNYTRQAYGSFSAVRIYNRALTADEVAANYALDQIRFVTGIPVTNAVIATTVAGATGAEGVGAFAVNGSHVFTAPPSVRVGSTTYACSGYTLQTWENGAWSSPVTEAGFAVTVSESEKVRITWQWAEANGTLDGSYVTDGLVLWYDGVWNVGVGVHDSSATVWRDLSVSGNDAALFTNGVTTYGTAGWTDNAFAFYRNAWFETMAGQSFGDTFTIQTVGSFSQSTPSLCNWPMLFYGSAGGLATLQMYWNNSADSKRVFLLADRFTGASGGNASGRPYSTWAGRYLTAVLEKNASGGRDAWMFEGIEYPTEHPGYVAGGTSSSDFSSETKWAVGSIPSTVDEGERSARLYTGTIHAVRVYSRKLSPAEIAQNRAMDEARFFGGSNRVEIAADPRGFSGREAPGVYAPNGWTFTSGTATQSANGLEYAPAGYIVEMWDNESDTWRVAETSDSATTYTTPAAPFAARRLTWKWTPVSGIRSASDYDISDYVQGGLVVWLDGIRNVGADQPHDSAATTWVDLSSRADKVTLNGNNRSHWTDDGYYFCLGENNECSYAYLHNRLSLGETGTIEMACAVKGSDQYAPSSFDTWPRYVAFNHDGSTDYDMSVHQWKGEGRCRWKADNWTGGNNRANLSTPWDGKHAAFVMDTAKFYSFKSGVVEETQNRTALKTLPKVFWMIGNKYNDVKAGNQLTGAMKAVRVYNRPLSATEIAHNYKVDVARFDGALSVTNVLVAASDYNGDLAADAYEVYGSHSFAGTAGPDGGPNRVKVWTFQNGSWGQPEVINEASYTYVSGVSPAMVKIEFGKATPFVVVVR